MLPEQLVVAVDEFGLPYSGKELALVYAVQLLGGAHFTTSRSNGSGRNKYYFYAGLVQLIIWSTKADMRVTSRVPSRRVKTLLPTLTAILLKSISIFLSFRIHGLLPWRLRSPSH